MGWRGGGLKQLLSVMNPCISFCVLPSCLISPGISNPCSALYLSQPQFYFFLFFLITFCQPPNNHSLNATRIRPPIFFLNLDLVSLSETCFSTKRFPSDTAEEKYVSIVCEALLCPHYHTDRWITHIPPLPSNKLPAERPQRLH